MSVDFFKGYETISFSREGRILTITLNLPDTLNAVNARMHTELARVFLDANDDPDSDIVVPAATSTGCRIRSTIPRCSPPPRSRASASSSPSSIWKSR
jgi:1,4-dihydroxy-2-naphthoyl-CoA synthase